MDLLVSVLTRVPVTGSKRCVVDLVLLLWLFLPIFLSLLCFHLQIQVGLVEMQLTGDYLFCFHFLYLTLISLGSLFGIEWRVGRGFSSAGPCKTKAP